MELLVANLDLKSKRDWEVEEGGGEVHVSE